MGKHVTVQNAVVKVRVAKVAMVKSAVEPLTVAKVCLLKGTGSKDNICGTHLVISW
ncbi:hypothetical protein OKN36_09080 [Furfurilactobacillus sp. OKN36]